MNCEGLPTRSRQEFCLALKAARERSGISLAEITKTTNIPSSLFAGLERNDLRHWPGGLFRRSFFRDYARAIGLPVAETCAEFVRLFPDEQESGISYQESGLSNQEPAARSQEPVPGTNFRLAQSVPGTDFRLEQEQSVPGTDFRLELDARWHGPRWSVLKRLLTAAIDAGMVILVAVAGAWMADQDRLAAIATVALAYFCLATPLFGESPMKWMIARRRSILNALMAGPAAVASAWKRGSDAISRVVGNAGGTDEPVEEPATPRWISDARRVGPAPRLRVRFKASR